MAEALAEMHARDLRDMWQGRVLEHTRRRPIGLVVLSVLAHNYDEAMPVLLRVVFPGFQSITAPFICSAAKVDKAGRVVADLATREGSVRKDFPLFGSELDMQSAFRRLADEMKLSDTDRVDLFAAVKRWVVADRRLDPHMNPKDPDAKRLTVH